MSSIGVRSVPDLPETTVIRARPVYARFLKRMEFLPMDPPTDEEMRDAIKVMKELHPAVLEIDDVLLAEAERIFIEAAS